jgi:hypothetical protein
LNNLLYTDFDDSYCLPPNDSRLRGDRLGLEKNDLETAGKEKHRLEEKQRAIRKEREAKGEIYEPKYWKVCLLRSSYVIIYL